MNLFVSITGIILIAGAIVLFILNAKDEYTFKFNTKLTASITLAVGIIAIIVGNCFRIVPTGYTGVRTTFGQISEQPVQKGFNFKIPFVQKIQIVNNKQQDVKIDSEVWGEAKDKTPVFASNIVITYRIDPEKSPWIYANISDYHNILSTDIVASAVKNAMVELDVLNVTERSKIEPSVKANLQKSLNEKYGENTISIFKVVIDQMDFEKEYNEAIAKKSLAQKKQEQQEIENKTAIDKAKADKEVAIQKAEADAKSKIIAAEAEAEANSKIGKSLTDEVLKSKFYEKWNGQLPKVMGDGSVITDINDNVN